MITVTVMINGCTIYARSARRIKDGEKSVAGQQPNWYKADDGAIIVHQHEEGALVLAKKLLDRVLEP